MSEALTTVISFSVSALIRLGRIDDGHVLIPDRKADASKTLHRVRADIFV